MASWKTLAKPWRACLELAWDAYRAGSLPIGSVVVDKTGEVVARGRNRLHESAEKAGFLSGHRLAHAEVNALLDFDDVQHDPQSCTLYTTTEPCPLCVGAVRMMGIGALEYASRDPWAGCAAMFETVPYIRRKGVRVSSLAGSTFEAQLIALQVDAHLRRTAPHAHPFLPSWREVLPVGVGAGERLFEAGILERLKEQGGGARELLGVLSRALNERAASATDEGANPR